MVFGVPPMVLFAVLVPYELSNEAADSTEPYITPQTAFTMLSLFNALRFPLVGGWGWVEKQQLLAGLPACLPLQAEAGHAPATHAHAICQQHSHTPTHTHRPPPFSPPRPSCPPTQVVLPKALRCVSEAMNASRNLEKFLAADAAPRQDTEGKPGGQISQVGGCRRCAAPSSHSLAPAAAHPACLPGPLPDPARLPACLPLPPRRPCSSTLPTTLSSCASPSSLSAPASWWRLSAASAPASPPSSRHSSATCSW